MVASMFHFMSAGGAAFDRRIARADAVAPWVIYACFLMATMSPALGQSASRGTGEIADLGAIERAFQKVVADVSPSVVGLRVRRSVAPATALSGVDSAKLTNAIVVHGSGTVLSADGEILTNEHVVQRAASIDVLFSDGKSAAASVVASDARSDLAILRVDRHDLVPVRMCQWEDVARGQWSIALGNPFGLGSDGKASVSTGIIANLDRQLPGLGEIEDRLYGDMIQTTAAVNPGNSGGPLFNIRGELIGVVTAMHTRAVLDDGVGFAIPISPGRRAVIEKLRKGEGVAYGFLGMKVRVVSVDAASGRGGPEFGGVVIESIEPSGPAAKADLRTGDRIVRYSGRSVSSAAQLVELAGRALPGEAVVLDVQRDDAVSTVTIIVEERSLGRVAMLRAGGAIWRGLRVEDVCAHGDVASVASRRLSGAVVVVEVVPNSAAAKAGFRVGEIIERIDGQPVAGASEFVEFASRDAGTSSVMLRGGERRIVRP